MTIAIHRLHIPASPIIPADRTVLMKGRGVLDPLMISLENLSKSQFSFFFFFFFNHTHDI